MNKESMILACLICNSRFTKSDVVVVEVTCCKSLVHNKCYKDWMSSRCSDCFNCGNRLNAPRYHLSYKMADGEENKVLKMKPQSTKKENDQPQEQINKIKIDLLQLQEKFNISEQSKKELENKVLDIQCQYAESIKSIEDLKQKLQEFKIENERKLNASEHSEKEPEPQVNTPICTENKLDVQHQYTELVETIRDLKQLIQEFNIDNRKTQIFELKLKCIGEELEKEITNSIRRTIGKIYLRNYIEGAKNNANFGINDNGLKK